MRTGILAALLVFIGGSSVTWGQDLPASPLFEPPASTSPLWGNAETLLWWLKRSPLSTPLLTTTTNPNATDANGNNVAGGVGRDGTVILFGPGGQEIRTSVLLGGRLTVGGWLNPESSLGLEGRGFLLEQGSFQRTISSSPSGAPILALPLVDASGIFGGGENALALTSPVPPGNFSGSVTLAAHSRLWGAEANGIINFFRNQVFTIDMMTGFRYADLSEDVSLSAQNTNLTPVAAGGGVAFLNNFFDGTVTATDIFKARNQFFGSQIGARVQAEVGRAYVNLTGKLALGGTHQEININGISTLQTGGMTTQTPGGFYALPGNSGQRSSNVFSVIPELEVKVGLKFTEHIRGFLGYNFLYWTDVARPGQQIDRTVDLRQVPTFFAFDPTVRGQPSSAIATTGFWAQGINVGLEIHY